MLTTRTPKPSRILYNVASCWLYLKEYINDARSHERQKTVLHYKHQLLNFTYFYILRSTENVQVQRRQNTIVSVKV